MRNRSIIPMLSRPIRGLAAPLKHSVPKPRHRALFPARHHIKASPQPKRNPPLEPWISEMRKRFHAHKTEMEEAERRVRALRPRTFGEQVKDTASAAELFVHMYLLSAAWAFYSTFEEMSPIVGPTDVRVHVLSAAYAKYKGDTAKALEHWKKAVDASASTTGLKGRNQFMYIFIAAQYIDTLQKATKDHNTVAQYDALGYLADSVDKVDSKEAWAILQGDADGVDPMLARNFLKVELLLKRSTIGIDLLGRDPPIQGPPKVKEVRDNLEQGFQPAAALLRDSSRPRDRLRAIEYAGLVLHDYWICNANLSQIAPFSAYILSWTHRLPRIEDRKSYLLPWRASILPSEKLVAALVLHDSADLTYKANVSQESLMNAVRLARKAADLTYEARVMGKLPGWKWPAPQDGSEVNWDAVVRSTLSRVAHLLVEASNIEEAEFYRKESKTFDTKRVVTPLPSSRIGYNGLKIDIEKKDRV